MSQLLTSTRRLNINADVGESFGPYTLGNDAALMPFIDSANIACGMHAGDPTTMAKTVALALEHNTSIGAHPGFDDRLGFGRRQIKMRGSDLEQLIIYQIGALQGITRALGGKVTHVKPHGALNNMAHDDLDYAMAIARAIRAVDSDLIFVTNVGSKMQEAGENLNIRVAREAYADRQYDDNGKMLSRDLKGSVIRCPKEAVAHALGIVKNGAITSINGKKIPVCVDTFCIHGDEFAAPEIAQSLSELFGEDGFVRGT